MKQLIIILTAGIVLSSCKKEAKEADTFYTDFKLDKTEALADGKTIVTATLEVKDASSDRQNVVFKASSGTFKDSGKDTYTAKPEYESGKLIARAQYKVPSSVQTVTITAKPEYDSPLAEYEVQALLSLKASEPKTLVLQTSSYGIAANYLNEVNISGTLKNEDKKPVSEGYNVQFEDLLANDGPAGGKFRLQRSTTGDSSNVRTLYAAPAYSIGTTIKIKCTLLDAAGVKTGTFDTITLTVNQQ